ncbi:hypothetical protein E8E13_008547 [Curvularia kusanoi]|uniref:PHD-type domain-containing protein n=1 Tax=Curvularia kusanoi TaxID=90978 RepID=A0A9P4WAC6_CURKU|nr:hypothetical protein E8E13_008547 [Curvularia kusanoi]
MADVEDANAPAVPVPATVPAPAPTPTPNPDAQTTVNDFLDYTEFYPSDLVRSLTLIGDLDATYAEAVQQVHELTALYCKLPQLADRERPDPALLRKQIAHQLQKAINQREYAYTEAARLYEVTVRHCQRSSIIKRKLQAQPEPPSRDPTPPPVSPSQVKRTYERPRLNFGFDPARKHGTSRPRAYSITSSDESDAPRRNHLPDRSRKAQTYKDRPHKPRARAPGVAGTNVHSSIAGISTSNALAKLTPPPADARPGSKWAPWMKLTEYEMAVLRKQMKKNAVWTPSLTMVNRELERKHRTKADYELEKARCEAAGEEMLDEEPETLLQIATAQGLDDPALAATANNADGLSAPGEPALAREDSVEAPDGQTQLDTRRKKARGALRALEDATKTIQNAADGLKELTFNAHAVSTPPTSARKRSATRPATSKRKRDTTPLPTTESPTAEPDATADEESTVQPEAKRPRLQLIAPAPPPDSTPSPPAPASVGATASEDPPSPIAPSPATQSPLAEINANTVQVPLAPAGPGTPEADLPDAEDISGRATPVQPSPLPSPSPIEPKRSSPVVAIPAHEPTQPALTAPSTRSQRKSITPKNSSPPPMEPSKPRTTRGALGERAASIEPTVALRPRSSRSHVPTPKAQSEEPKPNEGRPVRDTRRHSIFSQSALTATAPTRASTRRKAPPKGEVSAAENGEKTVTNVKRSKGSKNNRKKNAGGQVEEVEEVNSDEETYCICNDYADGPMVYCDNNCEKEWFHFECVGIKKLEMPNRRAKWYCPDCRAKLGTDAFGNPDPPPPLPGRSRGNRT